MRREHDAGMRFFSGCLFAGVLGLIIYAAVVTTYFLLRS